MSVWMILLIIFGVMMTMGVGSCLVCVGFVNHTTNTTATAPAAAASAGMPAELTQDEATSRALVACNGLVQAGVAQNCRPQVGGPQRDNVGWGIASFNIPGAFPNDEGLVSCYRNDAEYEKRDIPTDVAADDYANLAASSAKTRLVVATGTSDMNPDKWDDCMDKKKSVAACAKLFPKQYAAFHSLHDAAARIVNEEGTNQAVTDAAGQIRAQHDLDERTTSAFLTQCKDAVRSKLAFPDTADFHFVGIALQVVVLDGGGRAWHSDVTAKNAFGMEVKHNFTCASDPKKGFQASVD